MGPMRRVTARAVRGGIALGLLSPVVAHATIMQGRFENETYFSPGILMGGALRDGRVAGVLGAEVSVHHINDQGVGVGGFAQWQWMALHSHRFNGGVQVTSSVQQGLGLELGASYETGDERFAGTASVHLAPFVSFGIVALSLRFGIPFYSSHASSLPGRGFEGGLNLTLKFPNLVEPEKNPPPPPPPSPPSPP